MKLTATGGTDVATMVLFWPGNLSDDADETLKHDPADLMEQMRAEGKLIGFPCDSDGEYTVGIFVDSKVPERTAGVLP